MIKITVELLKNGNPKNVELLGVAYITNDRSSEDTYRGNYSVELTRRGQHNTRIWRKGEVTGFPRKRQLVWDLLFAALRSCGLHERMDRHTRTKLVNSETAINKHSVSAAIPRNPNPSVEALAHEQFFSEDNDFESDGL